jgi:hypothetical protein
MGVVCVFIVVGDGRCMCFYCMTGVGWGFVCFCFGAFGERGFARLGFEMWPSFSFFFGLSTKGTSICVCMYVYSLTHSSYVSVCRHIISHLQ